MMNKYIAFLRAINIGGRRIKMDYLRSLFESLDLKNVETFIASGNVIFEAQNHDTKALEYQIAKHLGQNLGYEVATFIRSNIAINEIAMYKPFGDINLPKDNTLSIAFISQPISPEKYNKLLSYQTEIDNFHVNGLEIYWRCRKKLSQSKFSSSILEKTIGAKATIRNYRTIERLIDKYFFIPPHAHTKLDFRQKKNYD